MAKNGPRKGEDRLVVELAGGATVRDAAERAGIGERTAHRHVRDPEIRQRIAETRDALFAKAIGRLANSSSQAVDTLAELLADGSPMVRLGAARAILEYGLRLRDAAETTARVAELENKIALYMPQLAARTGA